MPLSGSQTTQLWPYGGPGQPYGSFSGKSPSKSYTATFTRHAIYGGIGRPYGSFAGKTGGTPFNLSLGTITLTATVSTTSSGFTYQVDWPFEPPLEIGLTGTLGVTGAISWNPVGTLARTNANDTLVSAGTTTIVGTLAKTNANDTISASGTVGTSGPVGTLAYTNNNDTSTIAGTVTILGTLSTTNSNDTLAGSGGGTVVGTLAVTNQNDTSNISGVVGDPPVGASTRLPLTGAGTT